MREKIYKERRKKQCLSNIRFGGEREESESKRAERGLERRRETERERLRQQ